MAPFHFQTLSKNQFSFMLLLFGFFGLGFSASWAQKKTTPTKAAPTKTTKKPSKASHSKTSPKQVPSKIRKAPPNKRAKATKKPTAKKEPQGKVEKKFKVTQPPRYPKEKEPWLLDTRIPMGISMLGGLGMLITGIVLQTDQQPLGFALVSGGVSFFFSFFSAYMWAKPTTRYGVIGTLLTIAAVVGGLVLSLGVSASLPAESGFGLLGSAVWHLLMNIIGWTNLRHAREIDKIRWRRKENQKLHQPKQHPAASPRSRIRWSVMPTEGGMAFSLGTTF